MLRAALALTLLLSAAIACGDDAATSKITELTVVNASDEVVAVYINGTQSSLEAGEEDTISLEGADEYAVLVTGLSSGEIFFSDTLSRGDIEDLDGRLVVGSP